MSPLKRAVTPFVPVVIAVMAVAGGQSLSAGASNSGPPPLYEPSMSYDAASHQLLLFGGGAATMSSQTWEFSGGAWRQLHPPDSPSARQGAAMAYDPDLRALVLFGGVAYTVGDEAKPMDDGGRNTNVEFTDTWEWNGTTWSPLPDATIGNGSTELAQSVGTIEEPSLAYDAVDHEMVLDEICTNDCYFHHSRTWVLRQPSLAWERAVTPQTMPWNETGQFDTVPVALSTGNPVCYPGQNAGPSRAVADDANGGLLYVGRGQNDIFSSNSVPDPHDPMSHTVPETWTFAASSWHPLPGAVMPNNANELSYPVMGIDARGRDVLFAEYGQTWVWDGSSWREARRSPSPGTRCGEAMAFDPDLGRDVLYGGVAQAGGMYTDTWGWDGSAWSRVAGAPAPVRVPSAAAQSPPSGVGIPSTKTDVINLIREQRSLGLPGSPEIVDVQVKLVRARAVLAVFPNSGIGPPAQPDRLYWAVLVHCTPTCVTPHGGVGFPNRTSPSSPQPAYPWTIMFVDPYGVLDAQSVSGRTFSSYAEAPPAWTSLDDQVASPHPPQASPARHAVMAASIAGTAAVAAMLLLLVRLRRNTP